MAVEKNNTFYECNHTPIFETKVIIATLIGDIPN